MIVRLIVPVITTLMRVINQPAGKSLLKSIAYLPYPPPFPILGKGIAQGLHVIFSNIKAVYKVLEILKSYFPHQTEQLAELVSIFLYFCGCVGIVPGYIPR